MELPDPSEVRAERRRRRWPTVVGVGVLAGAATVVGVGAPAASPPPTAVAPLAPPAATTVVAVEEDLTAEEPADPAVEADLAALREVFWDAGYGPGDAAALAELWGTDEENATADAGQRLSEGIPLPIAPGSAPDPVEAVAPVAAVPDDVDAHSDAGDGRGDAVTLAGP